MLVDSLQLFANANQPVSDVINRLMPDMNIDTEIAEMTDNTPAVIQLLMHFFASGVTMADVMAIMYGQTAALNTRRPMLRAYFVQHIMNDNSAPSTEDIANAARRMVRTAPSWERVITEVLHLRSRTMTLASIADVDIPATMQTIERTRLRRCLAIILESASDADVNPATFAQRLVDAMWMLLRDLVFLIDHLTTHARESGTVPAAFTGDAVLAEVMRVSCSEHNECNDCRCPKRRATAAITPTIRC